MILSAKSEMSMDSPNSMRNNTYLLTLQANCATISQMRKHTTPTRPDYFLFLREIQAKVLTEREPWERGCFARLADRWICQVFKRSILFYYSDTTRSFRPVPLWLRKPFSRISYSLDSMHSKT